MARVTIEDCLKEMDDRFRIVLAASKRAKAIKMGAEPEVDPENDKATVIALREIAAGYDVTGGAVVVKDFPQEDQDTDGA